MTKNITKSRKISIAAKKRWGDPAYRKKMEKVFSTQKFKNKVSKANLELWSDENYRKKMEKTLSDPEVIKRHKDAVSNPKTRKKISKSKKEQWKDENYRKKMSINMGLPVVAISPENKRYVFKSRQMCISGLRERFGVEVDAGNISKICNGERKATRSGWRFQHKHN